MKVLVYRLLLFLPILLMRVDEMGF